MRAEQAAKSEKKSRKKTKKWRKIKKKLIKKSTVYQLQEFSTVLDITKGKKSLDEERNKKDFFDKLLNGLNMLLNDNYLLRYFQSSYQDSIQVGLEFNVNSNNENVSKPIFKSIKNISLGQKVVAILDFIFIYGQFTDDRKTLLID